MSNLRIKLAKTIDYITMKNPRSLNFDMFGYFKRRNLLDAIFV